MLSNLQAQELVTVFNNFWLAILNPGEKYTVAVARQNVDAVMKSARIAQRLTGPDLVLIFDLFVAHDFLRKSAQAGPGMLSTTINTTYEHRPYTQADLTILHARLI